MSSSYEYGSYSERPRDPYYSSRSRDQSGRYYSSDPYSSSPRSSSHSYYPEPPRTRNPQYDVRRPRRWPPAPTVEDAVDSLAKEFGNASLADEREDGARMPGSPDQQYILEEIEQPEVEQPKIDNDERRFVRVSGSPTDDEYDDASERRSRRRKGPALNTDLDTPVNLARRSPSPYAFSNNKPSNNSSKRSSGEYLLSPEPATPSAFKNVPRSIPYTNPSDRKPPNLTPERSSDLSTKDSSVFEDSDVELDEELKKNTRKSARYSFNPSVLSREDMRMSLNDPPRSDASSTKPAKTWPSQTSSSSQSSRAASPPPPPQPPRPADPRDKRPVTAEPQKQTPPRSIDPREKRPVPLEPQKQTTPTRPSYIDSNFSSKSSKTTSTPNSPRPKDSSLPPSPPRSPYEEPKNFTTPLSKPQSRPASPLYNASSVNDLPTPPNTSDGRDPKRMPTVESRSRPEPRVPSSLRHDTLPPPPPRVQVQSPSPARKPTLPYPENNHAGETMPSLDSYAPRVPDVQTRDVPKPSSRGSSRANSPVYESPKSPRPPMSSRRTDDYVKPTWENSGSDSESRRRRRRGEVKTRRVLTPCPRPNYTTQYDDWYSLEKHNNFAVCPSCYNNMVVPAGLDSYFERPRKRSASTRVKCDFANSWVRMAWLHTEQDPESTIPVLNRLAEIAARENQCPNHEKVPGVWYGLQHNHSLIPDLFICPYDVMQLEALFPALIAVFTRIIQPEGIPRIPHLCSLRLSSSNFTTRLDILAAINDAEEARHRSGSRRGTPLLAPDMTSFAKLFPPACPRDTRLPDQNWYYMDRLPELHVCEQCYRAVILPGIEHGWLGRRFNARAYALPESFGELASCQLYSPRMRRVWEDAHRRNDLVGLAEQVVERRRMEDTLQRESGPLKRRLAELEGWTGPSVEYDRRRLQVDLERIVDEWKLWE